MRDGFVAQFDGGIDGGGGGNGFEARRLSTQDAAEAPGLSLGEIGLA